MGETHEQNESLILLKPLALPVSVELWKGMFCADFCKPFSISCVVWYFTA